MQVSNDSAAPTAQAQAVEKRTERELWSLSKLAATATFGAASLIIGAYATYALTRNIAFESKLREIRANAYVEFTDVDAKYLALPESAKTPEFQAAFNQAKLKLTVLGDADVVRSFARLYPTNKMQVCGSSQVDSANFWQTLRQRIVGDSEHDDLRREIALLSFGCLMPKR